MTLNGEFASAGQIIPVAQLSGLKFTPALSDVDTASFTFYYNDGKDNSEETSAMIFTILPDPHTPTLSTINDLMVFAPTPIPAIPFTVEDPQHDLNSLTLYATSSNQTVIPNSHLQILGTGENRTLRVKPGHHPAGATTITIYASDGIGTDSTAFVITISHPGTKEGQRFTVFPNPFRSSLNIHVPEEESFDLQITDLVGRRIVTTCLSVPTQLDLSNNPAGVYIVKIVSKDKRVFQERVIKQH